jgi:hypothetical protein
MFAQLTHGPVVNVRWQPDASDAAIVEAERQHGLTRLDPNSPHSWQYELSRWSKDDVERIVRDPLAADTNGIDRSTFELRVPAPNGLASWLTRVPGPGDGLRLGENAIALFFYTLWLLPIATATVLLVRWARESPLSRAMLVMIIVLQVAMNMTMLRDPLQTRMRDVVVPLALLLSYLGGLVWRTSGTGVMRAGMRVVALAMLALVVGSAAALGGAPEQIEKTRVAEGVSEVRQRMRTLRRSLSPPDHRTGVLPASYKPLVDYIGQCTRPESRLLTLTFAPELFFYTGRAFAGGQVSLSPGYFASDNDTRLLVERASREDVSLVVMDSQTEKEMLDGYPRIAAYVRARYHEVGRFPLTSEKAFVLFGGDRAARSVVIAGQQLPCEPH